MFIKWVTIKIASAATGYTQEALRAKIKKGVWAMGIHWKKAPDGRVVFNLMEIEQWMGS